MTENRPEERRLARLETICEQQTTLLTTIHDHVVGKPGTAGLTERVGKVEQRQGFFMKGFWTVASAVVGLVVWLIKGQK